jgi:transposase InsO family protein
MPLQTELFDRLGGARFFSVLDLKSGYWQIPVRASDREKTAFVTHRGLFEFRVMPFGLCNAPATFQDLMNNVLGDLIYRRKVLVYLDDIIIWSSSFEEHMELLEEVFSRLRDAGLKLNLKKCKLFASTIKYLGFIINESGVHADPAKIVAITNYPRPANSSDLRRFYGMASYLRRHIPHFAEHAAPLCKLLSVSDCDFTWSSNEEEAFRAIKEAIASSAQLAHPQFDLPFRVSADASNNAVGAMLSQLQDGVDTPIAFASRSLITAETHYPTTEKEALALVFATQQFRHYLHGSRVKLLSDHKPLLGLRTSTKLNVRMQRWAIWLEQFDFDIEYVPGEEQFVADALSRAPVDLISESFDDIAFPPLVRQIDLTAECRLDDDLIRRLQLEDPVIGPVLQQLIVNRRRKPTTTCREAAHLASKFWHIRQIGGLFYFTVNNRNLLLVPEALRAEVLYYCHSCTMAAHAGLHTTLDRLRAAYYWPNMGNDARRYVLACRSCGQSKPFCQRKSAPLQSIVANHPLEYVAMDVVNLSPTPRGFCAALVVTDLFTKWAEVYPLRSHTTEEISGHLIDFICRYGIPSFLLTDQGGEFESNLLNKLYQHLGLRKIRTAPYHPRTDGQAERFNRSLIEMIRATTCDRQRHWDEVLSAVLFAYRSAVNASTGYSPYEMLYGRPPKLPGHLVLGEFINARRPTSAHVSALQKILRQQWNDARNKLDAARARQKRYYDRYTNERSFEKGDLVWLASPSRTAKLLPAFLGPFEVEARLPNGVNYRIRRFPVEANHESTVVNIDRLKPCGQFEHWMARSPALPTTASLPAEQVAPFPCVAKPMPTSSSHESDSDSDDNDNDAVQFIPDALVVPLAHAAPALPTRILSRPSRQPYRPGLVNTDEALRHLRSNVETEIELDTHC